MSGTRASRPIGIFDSGMGGLTVMRALAARLPNESFVYLGDTARLPYGTKSADTVARYAVQAAGFLQRPSEDIDLFTVWERRGEFETAAAAIVAAYRTTGLHVTAERRHDTFIRLTVSDGVQTAKVELGVDLRANEPVRISSRALIRNERNYFARQHRFEEFNGSKAYARGSASKACKLQRHHQPDDADRGRFADALSQAELLDDDDFAQYGLVGAQLDDLRRRFAKWRADLLGGWDPAL